MVAETRRRNCGSLAASYYAATPGPPVVSPFAAALASRAKTPTTTTSP